MDSDSEIELEDDLEEIDVYNARPKVSLRDLALQNRDDPETFDGPVFPYWGDQPTSPKDFWRVQKIAVEHISKCIDDGVEVIDLK